MEGAFTGESKRTSKAMSGERLDEMISSLSLQANNGKVQLVEGEGKGEETFVEEHRENNAFILSLRQSPAPLAMEASGTAPGTGFLHNLTTVQREKLFQLWGMIFKYLGQPYDSEPSRKRKEVSMAMLRQTQLEAYQNERVSEQETDALDANPLTMELFAQFGTDDPDRILLRFLRARKWLVPDAFNMLTDALKWRHSINLRQLMLEGERRIKLELLEGGKNYFWREDRRGGLVCYIRSRLHDRNAQTLQESIDFTVYTVEVGRRLRSNDEQLVTVVFDLKDAPLASLDIGTMQFMVQALQSFYPEILGKCLVMDAPWIFNGFWKLVKPLLDPVVAAKIEFIKQEDLIKYMEEEAIPLEYGGDSRFEFKYVLPNLDDYPRTPNEPISELLLARMEVLKSRFIESSREIYSLVTRVEDPVELETLLVPLRERRDEIKTQLQSCYKEMDGLVLPRNFYHRIGVLDDDGGINWDNYKQPPPPLDMRASAPPTLGK
jgi:hypothetical protein